MVVLDEIDCWYQWSHIDYTTGLDKFPGVNLHLKTAALSQHVAPLAGVQAALHRALAAHNAQDVARPAEHDAGPVEVGHKAQAPFGVAPHQADHDDVVFAPLRCVRRNDPPPVSRGGTSSVHVPIIVAGCMLLCYLENSSFGTLLPLRLSQRSAYRSIEKATPRQTYTNVT